MNDSMTKLSKLDQDFIRTVMSYFDEKGRDLPWRRLSQDKRQRFYQVLVSEIMLQQTQVPRVIAKYNEWMELFPTMSSVVDADFSDVLRIWVGLGYNRRAKYLYQSIIELEKRTDEELLTNLTAIKGIGKNTAGAIITYCDDIPNVYVETNIRTCIIYHYFHDQTEIHDKQIEAILMRLNDHISPRIFYWAMMDYGTYLKQHTKIHRSSRHYKKQSLFAGSRRELRGKIIAELTKGPSTIKDLSQFDISGRIEDVLNDLEKEEIVSHRNGRYEISTLQ